MYVDNVDILKDVYKMDDKATIKIDSKVKDRLLRVDGQSMTDRILNLLNANDNLKHNQAPCRQDVDKNVDNVDMNTVINKIHISINNISVDTEHIKQDIDKIKQGLRDSGIKIS